MKRYIAFFVLLVGLFSWAICATLPADAARKAQKARGGLSEKQVTEIGTTIDTLTKKYYMRELFSPYDSELLITSKIQLDGQMDITPETSLAPIYYKTANLFKLRGMKNEAIDCYQTILENFSETAYGPKARKELKDMGVEIKENLLPKDEEF